MQTDLRFLVVSALIGLLSASLLEFVKAWIERRRLRSLEQQALQKRRTTELAGFLRGSKAEMSIPDPAWLRVAGVEVRGASSFLQPLRLAFARPSRLYSAHTVPYKIDLAPPAAKKRPRPARRQRSGANPKGRKILLGPLTLLGRDPLCDICLFYDESVSLEHALIRFEGDGYYLYDLGSINGTWVNGARLEPRTRLSLQGGEELVVGRTRFEFGALRPELKTPHEPGSPPQAA